MKRRKIVYNENEENKNNFNKNLMLRLLLLGKLMGFAQLFDAMENVQSSTKCNY